MESRFLEPLRETKLGLKNRIVEQSGVKLQRSTEKRETTIGSRKIEDSRNRDSAVDNCLGSPGGGALWA